MRIILITILSLSSLTLFAQHSRHGNHRGKENHHKEKMSPEKLEAQKIAYFSTQLDLTPAQAQEFWPVYNQYSNQKKQIREKRRARPDLTNLDDEQADKLLDQFVANKQIELDLDKEYIEKFKQVLPSQKVIMVFILERKFKEQMLNDVRRRMNQSN